MNQVVLRELAQRKSVRVFEERPIPQEEKDAILHSAIQAPTAGNQCLYTILDITDQALKERLAETCDHQPFIAKAPMVLIFLADCRRWPELFRAGGCAPREPEAGDLFLAMADALIAAQNAVTAAWSLGIGSCYIGDILENCEEHRRLLGLPAWVVPAAMVVFGYPTQQQLERKKPLRFSRDYLVAENRYPDFSPEEHLAAWEEPILAQGRTPDAPRELEAFCNRKYNSDFSREMSRSALVYLRDFLPKDPEAPEK